MWNFTSAPGKKNLTARRNASRSEIALPHPLATRKHMVVQDEDMMVTTPEQNFPAVMWTPHQREQRNRWGLYPLSLL